MDRTDSKSDTPLTRGRSLPVRYQVIDKDGNVMNHKFAIASEAAWWAKGTWPDQEQDETRSGKGWDIEVCE